MRIPIILLLICSSLLMADQSDSEPLAVPHSMQELSAYCARFLALSLEQPIGDDLLAQDGWEHNMTLLEPWDDSRAEAALWKILAAQTVRPNAFGLKAASAQFASAIAQCSIGWKKVAAPPERLGCNPDTVHIFEHADLPEAYDDFVRFIVVRMGGHELHEAVAVRRPADCRRRKGALCLLVKKTTFDLFQRYVPLGLPLGDESGD